MSKYIMVSFQSKYREIVRRIVDRLRKEGYIVWMDETDMENRIADDLANAIKDAEVVLVCLSSNYKDSVYCERESNNVAHFRKPFIVLMMERFTMDGWVANYYSERLYTDFSKEEMFETGFQNLLERLQRDHPHLSRNVPNPTPSDSQATTNNPLPSNPGGAGSTVSGAQSTAPSGYQTDRRQVAEASGDQNDGQQGRCLSQNALVFISEEVGAEWKQLGLYLGLKFKVLEKIKMNNHDSVESAIMKMLMTWQGSTSNSDDQLELMCEALIKHGNVFLADELREKIGLNKL